MAQPLPIHISDLYPLVFWTHSVGSRTSWFSKDTIGCLMSRIWEGKMLSKGFILHLRNWGKWETPGEECFSRGIVGKYSWLHIIKKNNSRLWLCHCVTLICEPHPGLLPGFLFSFPGLPLFLHCKGYPAKFVLYTKRKEYQRDKLTHLLQARHHAMCFTCINSFNLTPNQLSVIIPISNNK